MRLFLIDTNLEVVKAWTIFFNHFRSVTIIQGDILQIAENCLVSPANRYGLMDGGIDRLYLEYFGFEIQNKVQAQISLRKDALLPVGAAILINTGNKKIPYMITAPTMEMPQQIPPHNIYFAMSTILKVATTYKKIINKIYCPGLGTGVGMVNPIDAAKEMANAYRKWLDHRLTG